MNNTVTVCNLNFHTSMGGTQQTLSTILPIISKHYRLIIIDPYRNHQFANLMSENDLSVETVVDLSGEPQLSKQRGLLKAWDYLAHTPKHLNACSKLQAFMRKEHVDLVYVNQTKAAALMSIGDLRQYRLIYHCHDAEATGITLLSLIKARFSSIVANSEYTRTELIRKGFDSGQVIVNENVIAIDLLRKQALLKPVAPLPASNKNPVILVAHAGIEPNKGTIVAVEALGALKRDGINADLWIMGAVAPQHEQYAASVRHAIGRLALGDQVTFLGFRSDTASVMAAADIVIVPTVYRESFGRVAAEAMALAKVVAVSNCGALPELVQDGFNGFVFAANDSGSLASALSQVVLDSELRVQMGLRASESANCRSDLKKYEEQLVSIISTAVLN